jgi:hypothetical protein
MNRKLQRTTDAAIKGVNYIDGELAMWGEKYSGGGAIPKSVKRRVARLVEARKVAVDMQNEKEPQNDIEKKMLEMEKSS